METLIEILTFCAFAFVIYIVIPFIILKIKGTAKGRSKREEFFFIMIKVTFFFFVVGFVGLIFKVLRGILT